MYWTNDLPAPRSRKPEERIFWSHSATYWWKINQHFKRFPHTLLVMEQGMWKTVLKTWNVPIFILLKPVVAWEIFVYTILSKWQKCKSNNIKYAAILPTATTRPNMSLRSCCGTRLEQRVEHKYFITSHSVVTLSRQSTKGNSHPSCPIVPFSYNCQADGIPLITADTARCTHAPTCSRKRRQHISHTNWDTFRRQSN